MNQEIDLYWNSLVDVLQVMSVQPVKSIARELHSCYKRGGTVFVLGNGGSAATASHMACDLAKGTRAGGAPTFKVLSLTDNVPLLTAWSNDAAYDCALAEQLASFVQPGDLVLAISASGNSPNVLRAIQIANQSGATTVGLTGRSGGRLARLVDVDLRVPSDSIEQVEDAHMIVAHSVCVALRSAIQAERSDGMARDIAYQVEAVTD